MKHFDDMSSTFIDFGVVNKPKYSKFIVGSWYENIKIYNYLFKRVKEIVFNEKVKKL